MSNTVKELDRDTEDNVKLKHLWKLRANELRKKKVIGTSEVKRLEEMISSPDLENFTMAREIIRVHMRGGFADGLNKGQLFAFDNILDFLNNPEHDALVLKGYAGTGKTFLVKRVINYIMHTHPKHSIAVTAPTNKAVQVLFKSSSQSTSKMSPSIFEELFDSNSRLMYSTIHRLLSYKEKIMPDGKRIFVPDTKNRNYIGNYDVLILDEVSMLDDKICEDIMKFSKDIRIIFMGDPAQIPPVHKDDCIPFRGSSAYKFRTVELTEIMRQKGEHAIVDYSFHIRNNLLMNQPIVMLKTKLNSHGHGVIHFDGSTERTKIVPLMTQLFKTPEFVQDANYAKVIAWRNDVVKYMNDTVREIIYGKDPDRFMRGEKLLANKPIFTKRTFYDRKGNQREGYGVAFYTSEELSVIDIELGTVEFSEGMYHADLKAYSLEVKGYDAINDLDKNCTITVIHEDSKEDFKKLLEASREYAKKNSDPEDWRVHYNIQKWDADLTYNYAITAHKSQGSTYNNVILIEDDLDANRKTLERNRIKYTSYSRASDILYVLRKNPTL